MTTPSDDILSWTNQDPRESQLFNSWGVVYRFQTKTMPGGHTVTQVWRAARTNKEERVAKLEWSPNGGLGRALLGKNISAMSDLMRYDRSRSGRCFTGPDGLEYMWRTSPKGSDLLLHDPNGIVIAFYRPLRQTRYQIGDVFGELHLLRAAGAGTIMHPPMMDAVIVTAMLYRFCSQWNLF